RDRDGAQAGRAHLAHADEAARLRVDTARIAAIQDEATRADGWSRIAPRREQAGPGARLQREGRPRPGARAARLRGAGLPPVRRRVARTSSHQEKTCLEGGERLGLLSNTSVSIGYLPSST